MLLHLTHSTGLLIAVSPMLHLCYIQDDYASACAAADAVMAGAGYVRNAGIGTAYTYQPEAEPEQQKPAPQLPNANRAHMQQLLNTAKPTHSRPGPVKAAATAGGGAAAAGPPGRASSQPRSSSSSGGALRGADNQQQQQQLPIKPNPAARKAAGSANGLLARQQQQGAASAQAAAQLAHSAMAQPFGRHAGACSSRQQQPNIAAGTTSKAALGTNRPLPKQQQQQSTAVRISNPAGDSKGALRDKKQSGGVSSGKAPFGSKVPLQQQQSNGVRPSQAADSTQGALKEQKQRSGLSFSNPAVDSKVPLLLQQQQQQSNGVRQSKAAPITRGALQGPKQSGGVGTSKPETPQWAIGTQLRPQQRGDAVQLSTPAAGTTGPLLKQQQSNDVRPSKQVGTQRVLQEQKQQSRGVRPSTTAAGSKLPAAQGVPANPKLAKQLKVDKEQRPPNVYSQQQKSANRRGGRGA
jgi:hypothetical protein